MSDERRIFPRKTLRTQVVLEDELGEGFIYFYTTDVSLGGLFMESEIPLKLGTKIFLSFRLTENSEKIRTTGEVMRLEKLAPTFPGISGMGIRFIDLPDEDLEAIKQFDGTLSTD